MHARWEAGSEFEWGEELISNKTDKDVLVSTLLEQPHSFFSTGTSALCSIPNVLNGREQRPRLHLPSFFCMDVAEKLSHVFDLLWYRDLPSESQPDFSSLRPLPRDVVLAVNFFGMRSNLAWNKWVQEHKDVILIEDHTHDPFSKWALESKAHYAIASLRKTLPIPDGAIIWSPQNLKIPEPKSEVQPGVQKKIAAMLFKRAYLNGSNISKDIYRQLQIEAEEDLFNSHDSAISEFSIQILKNLDVTTFRQRRSENTNQLTQEIAQQGNSDIQPLFRTWPKNASPFNTILICKNLVVRNNLRLHLIRNNIFPAIHWQCPANGVSPDDLPSIKLSECILTVPSDFRYNTKDIHYVASKINEYRETL